MTVKTDFGDTKESARRERFEPTGTISSTNTQKAVEEVASESQPLDATLTALSNLTATPGLITVVSQDVFTQRILVAPATGISITNAAASGGNPTFALANDIAALENLSGTGFAVRIGNETWTNRVLVAPAAGFTITNASGTGGDPTFALANTLQSIEGINTLGLVAFIASDTVTTRTATAGAGITITNGAATGGNPTFALTNISSSTFLANASGASAAPSETTRTQAQNILALGTPYCYVARTTNQSFTTNQFTRVALDTELFDSNGAFDNATNFRFTPLVAGKYYATFQAQITATYTGGQAMNVAILKNGATTNIVGLSSLTFIANTGSVAPIQSAAGFTALNGSTDFIDFQVFSTGTTPTINGSVTGSTNTFASVYYIGP